MTARQLRGLLVLLVVFAAGLLAGFVLNRLFPPRPALTTRLSIQMPEVLDRLGLTAAQRHAADSILEQSAPRAESVLRATVPRLSAIADSVEAELRQILTPEQSVLLDSLKKKMFVLKRKTVGPGGTKVDTVPIP